MNLFSPCSFMVSFLHCAENWARRLPQVSCYFLPCTWLSPEDETCHLWSLVRRMLLVHLQRLAPYKHNSAAFGGQYVTSFPSVPHLDWMRYIILFNKVENAPLWFVNFSFLTALNPPICICFWIQAPDIATCSTYNTENSVEDGSNMTHMPYRYQIWRKVLKKYKKKGKIPHTS